MDLGFIDASWHNAIIPWNRFRDAGVRGGIVKVSDGYFMSPDYTGHIDSQFKTNWQALDTFDLRGAYTYITFDANRSGGLNPARQVQLALDTIGDHKETDIYAIDVEQKPHLISHISLQARANMLADALQYAERYWDKKYIWVYTGAWWFNKNNMPNPNVDPMPYILSFPVWAAFYGARYNLKYHVPMGWKIEDVVAHQYSMTKKIAGITIDHNEFRWDWNEYLKIEPPAPVEPPPVPIPPTDPPNEPTPPDPIILPPKPPKSWLEWLFELILSFFRKKK